MLGVHAINRYILVLHYFPTPTEIPRHSFGCYSFYGTSTIELFSIMLKIIEANILKNYYSLVKVQEMVKIIWVLISRIARMLLLKINWASPFLLLLLKYATLTSYIIHCTEAVIKIVTY